MITVNVTVGVGGWKAHKTVGLVACPHVGDGIVVGQHVIMCDRVYIDSDHVDVEETRRFQSEAEADTFFDA